MNKRHGVTGNLYSGVDEEFITDFYEELKTSSETLVRKGTTQHGIVSQKSAVFKKLINFTGLTFRNRASYI
jgi:hypothetical protein